MGQTNLSWQFDGPDPEEFRVYRADAPMDPGALPTPLATAISGALRSYTDTTVVQGNTYYYRVSAVKSTLERVSEELEHVAEGVSDPLWPYVTNLLHFDGADGSTTFVDERGLTWTASGTAQLDDAQSKFGGTSLRLNGAHADQAVTGNNQVFALRTDSFCIEGWIRPESVAPAEQFIVCTRTSSSAPGGILALRGDKLAWSNGAAWLTGSAPVPVSQWTHFAVTRQSGTLRIYQDGVQVYSGADTTDYIGPRECRLGGADGAVPAPFTGWLDEVRITRWDPRYTAAFTVPAEPFQSLESPVDPYFADVALLINADGADGATTFTDSSLNAHTLTTNGGADIDTSWSAFGPSSARFHGTGGDGITTPAHASLAFGTGPFAIEFYMRLVTVTSKASTFVDNRVGGTAPSLVLYKTALDNLVQVYMNGTNIMSFTVEADTTYFVQVTRNAAGLVTLAVNGVIVNQVNNTTNFTLNKFIIGTRYTGDPDTVDGFMDMIRFTKGRTRPVRMPVNAFPTHA